MTQNLTPGTPEYYQAKLAAMGTDELLQAYRGVVSQFAGLSVGSDLWDTTRDMIEIATAEVARRINA